MSYKYSRITFRSTTDISFWEWPDEITQYVADTYDNTGLRESCTVIVSNDGLIQTRTSVWKDRASHIQFCNDPVLVHVWIMRDSYNAEHDIVSFWQQDI